MGYPATIIPLVMQAAQRNDRGCPVPREPFFKSRVRKHDFIDYNGRIQVRKSVIPVFLRDQLHGHKS